MPHTYSPTGLALTEQHEGCALTAYRDIANILTIGYGHTGPDVQPGQTITHAQASALLLKDLAWAEACVNQAVKVPLTQNQFDALVDFTFNAGRAAFEDSTLLTLLNAANYPKAAAQFNLWVQSKGKTIPGLVNRRAGETALFTTPDATPALP